MIFILNASLSFSQVVTTLSPSASGTYCPNEDLVFSYSINTIVNSFTILKQDNTQEAVIISQTTGVNPSSCTFRVKFADGASSSRIRIDYRYTSTSNPIAEIITFTKINSLFDFPLPNLSGIVINPAFCSTSPINFAFTPNHYAYSQSATITNYEYVVPVGWKVGSIVSNGTTPIYNGSTTTITPHPLSSGSIKVTPVSNCFINGISGLKKGQTATVNIGNRTNLRLVQNGATTIIIRKGDNAARTFTVENAAQAGCITEYQWNVANKGWLDAAGNPITTFITTTTPSLTLIPPCSGTPLPQDVEVVIKAGNDQLTSKVTVINSSDAVQLEISGPAEFCTSGTYNVTGTTCNIDVTWEMVYLNNHPNVVTISCTNCNSTTLTKYGNGTVLLRASVLIAGTTVPEIIERYIGVGTPVVRGWYNSPANPVQPLAITTNRVNPVFNDVCQAGQTITNMDITANATVLWSYGGYTGTSEPQIQWYQSGNNLNLIMFNEGDKVRFSLTTTNTCGSINNSYWFNSVAANCGGVPLRVNPVDTIKKKPETQEELNIVKVLLFPNPASNYVQIKLSNQKDKEYSELKEVRVTDYFGNIKIQQRFSRGVQSTNMNIGILKTGVYYVKVFNGFNWITEKLIVQ